MLRFPSEHEVARPSSTFADRCRAEFTEMPGLRLTLEQAARLWNVDPVTCARELDRLVRAGFLYKAGRSYVLAQAGRRIA